MNLMPCKPRPRSNLGIKKGTLLGFKGLIREPQPLKKGRGPRKPPPKASFQDVGCLVPTNCCAYAHEPMCLCPPKGFKVYVMFERKGLRV